MLSYLIIPTGTATHPHTHHPFYRNVASLLWAKDGKLCAWIANLKLPVNSYEMKQNT
jgi:hypothetical protein